MNLLSLTIIFCSISCLVVAEIELYKPLTDSFINDINNAQKLWSAGKNFHGKTPESFFKKKMGGWKGGKEPLPIKFTHSEGGDLPKNFDARQKWSNCPSIGEIRDEGDCDSCWAVASVGAMSDRICIRTEGRKQVHLSTNDLLSCCEKCIVLSGCVFGYPEIAWKYWSENGIVTGGEYGSNEGCRPYPFPPCEHGTTNGTRKRCERDEITPKCVKKCQDGYPVEYEQDKHFGYKPYSLPKDEEWIRREIYENGPVVGELDMYEDLISYKEGVYQHVKGEFVGGHVVKMFGWGEENGTPYWLIANSWNYDWGNNGTFKIIRGINHLDIEAWVVAGLARFG